MAVSPPVAADVCLCLGWTVLWGVTARHQSPVRDVHLNWVLAVAAFLLVALLVVVAASACPRLRRWLNG